MGDLLGAVSVFKDILRLFKRRMNQIELFSMKRVSIVWHSAFGYNVNVTHICASRQAEKLRSSGLTKDLCILSVIEILYLWKALANCSTETLHTMTEGKPAVRVSDRVWFWISFNVVFLQPCR